MNLISNLASAKGNSWVACFDLLGVANKTRMQGLAGVIPTYETIICRIASLYQTSPKIRYMWFSDAFLFYTPPNSNLSFDAIDYVTILFDYLIQRGIPFRGALAYGEFWADEDDRIYAGKAFLDAHQYAEAQDWIGYVIAPSALAEIGTRANPAERLRQHYRKVKVPLKSKYLRNQTDMTEDLYAFLFGSFHKCGHENCLKALQDMKGQTGSEPTVLAKYDRTIGFLEGKTLIP